MKFRHCLALFAVFALLLCLLSGCHGSRGLNEFVLPETLDTSRNLEITFWAKNDTNKTQVSIYQEAIADFEALYPNITVNLRLYTDYGRIYNDVITNIATNTTPNVCITYPDHIATYLTGSNTVVPLDTLLTDERYGLGGSELLFDSPAASEIVPQFLSECSVSGHTYALPFMRSTEACYVNKTLVEALGFTLPEDTLTWDFIWEVSRAAAVRNADGTYPANGQNVMIPFIYKSTDNMMIQYLRQAGLAYSTEDGENLLFNDGTSAFLYEIAGNVAEGAFSTFKISSYPANFLNAGQCVFAVDSTAGATWMGTDAPLCDIAEEKLVDFETVVYPVPQINPENPQMISQGPSVCIFNKADSQEVLASWLFAQFLLTDKVQMAYAETEGYVPVTTRAQQNPSYMDYLSRSGEDNQMYYPVKIAASELLLSHLEDTFTTPVFNGSASLRDAAGQLIESVVKSVRRSETVDDSYMKKLFSETEALYRLDQTNVGSTEKSSQNLGPLPAGARALIIVLIAVWLILGTSALYKQLKKRSIHRKKR